jgi:hypothetical protein
LVFSFSHYYDPAVASPSVHQQSSSPPTDSSHLQQERSSTTHRWLRTTINNNVFITSPSAVWKVHTPWSLFMMFNLTSVRAMLTLAFMFMLFNLTSMRAMLTLLFLFMMFNLTSIQAMFILVSEIAMIYVLVLIWKLSTFSAIMPNLFECYYSKSFLPWCVLCIRHSTFRVQIISQQF